MMMKKLGLALAIWMAMFEVCAAQSFDLALDVGSKSLFAGANYRKDLAQGYLKAGINAVYTDDDDTQYKWGSARVVVGNDTLVEGLTCEVGLVALIGDAEDSDHAGDIGALAFELQGKYLFPERILPIPIEVFSSVRYAPDLLSFRDTESYTEFNLGLGVEVIKNASIRVTYTKYIVDMNSGPGDWELNEDVLRAGIAIGF